MIGDESTAGVDVAVLGAGPAGLMAAYRLALSGRRVVVLEQAAHVGGLAASFRVDGQRVDHGSHRLHPATLPPVMAIVGQLLGADLQRRRRNGRLRLGDRWVGFPPRATDLARRVPLRLALRLGFDALAGPLRTPPREDTFAEVVRARLGPGLAERFYAPYVRKIWGMEPDELSGELARRRVSASSGGLVRRLLPGGDADRGFFYYPRAGFGEIVERLADAAVSAGAQVELGSPVDAVETLPGGIRLRSGSRRIDASHVWSTIPITALAERLEPAPPDDVIAAASRLRSRALVLVYVVAEVERFTEFDAHYVAGPEAAFARLSEPKNYRDGPDPDDRTVLCAEVPCRVGDPVWTADDETLGDLVGDGIRALGLGDLRRSTVVTRRVARAYPVYDRDYEEAFAAVDEEVAARPRLLTFGRQGLFAHDNSHHAMAMAWAAADAFGHDGVDAEQWRAARAEFAGHVVED